jgi:hypothetical protein
MHALAHTQKYVIVFAFPRQRWYRNVTLCVHCLSCLVFLAVSVPKKFSKYINFSRFTFLALPHKKQAFQLDSKDTRWLVAIWDNVLSKLKSIIMSRKKRRRNNGTENKIRENSESFHFRTSFGFSLISHFIHFSYFRISFCLRDSKDR